MANTIDSALQRDVLMEAAMTAFLKELLPLGLFSTSFRDVRLQGTDKMQVPYYPLDTAAAKDFDGSYVFDKGTSTDNREVTIDKRKYLPLSYTSAELARQPAFDPVKLGELRGRKLAEDVLTNILSVVTASNYGNTGYSNGNFDAAEKLTAAYSAFDMDDVIDLETIADTRNWPMTGRGLIIKPSYTGNMKKDIIDGGGLSTFGINPTGENARFPAVNSFSVATTNIIPGNSENLVGMAVYPSAVLVGFSPIEPAPAVRAALIDYVPYTDPATGLTIETRLWGDPKTDTTYWTMEVNYGFAMGEKAALVRITSS